MTSSGIQHSTDCPSEPGPRALLAEAAEHRKRGDVAAAIVAEVDAWRLARAASVARAAA